MIEDNAQLQFLTASNITKKKYQHLYSTSKLLQLLQRCWNSILHMRFLFKCEDILDKLTLGTPVSSHFIVSIMCIMYSLSISLFNLNMTLAVKKGCKTTTTNHLWYFWPQLMHGWKTTTTYQPTTTKVEYFHKDFLIYFLHHFVLFLMLPT